MSKIFVFVLLGLSIVSFLSAGLFTLQDKSWDDGTNIQIFWDLTQKVDSIHIAHADSLGQYSIFHKAYSSKGQYIHPKLEPDLEKRYAFIAFLDDDKTTDLHAYETQPGSYEIRKNKQQSLFGLSYEMLGVYAEPDSLYKPVLFEQASITPTRNWFNLQKLPLLILFLILACGVLIYIRLAQGGKDLFIRRINGLDSMEEAIGRATEKGKPILFVPGIGELDDIQTIASLSILSHLAYRAAEYNTNLIVPCKTSMVLSAAREVVKEAYLRAGRPDAFRDEQVFYLTDDQFGYVAGIDGIMLREQPAANFFLGTFYAESLILAETGFSTGAIQTSGTAQAHQLPFFVVSCDYTLIGEELYAASAYLSKDPQQLGSLKGCDFGKIVLISLILIGVVFEISGLPWFSNFLNMVE